MNILRIIMSIAVTLTMMMSLNYAEAMRISGEMPKNL